MKKSVIALLLVSLLLTAMISCTPQKETPTEAPTEAPTETPTETPTENVTREEVTTGEEKVKNPLGNPYTKPTDATKITSSNITSAFKKVSYTDSVTQNVLKVRYRIPDGYNAEGAYPVLIFLHGAGQRGNDNTAQITYALDSLFADVNSPAYGAIVIAPQCPENLRWVETAWTDNYDLNTLALSDTLHSVMDFLDYICDSYSVDADRIYVTGLSMGGYGTWDLISRYPDLFAGAVPMCGGGSPTTVDRIKDMPILTVHGDLDTSVPTQRSRDMVNALRAVGSEVIYCELPGYRHNVWDWTLSNSAVINWLFNQHK